MHKAKFQIL